MLCPKPDRSALTPGLPTMRGDTSDLSQNGYGHNNKHHKYKYKPVSRMTNLNKSVRIKTSISTTISVNISISLSLSTSISISISTSTSIYLSIYLATHPSIHLFGYIYVYIDIYKYIHISSEAQIITGSASSNTQRLRDPEKY